jgi:PKD repeat protein
MKSKYFRLFQLVLFLSVVLLISTTVQGQIAPNHISNLSLWLRADTLLQLSGSSVTEWDDCSGNGQNVLQATAAFQPTVISSVSSLNNNPVVRFDGVDDYLDGLDQHDLGTHSNTIYIVGRCNTNTGTFLAKSIAGAFPGRYAIFYAGSALYYVYQDDGDRSINLSKTYALYEIISATNDRVSGINTLTSNNQLLGSSYNNQIFDLNSTFDFLVGAYNNAAGGIPPYNGFYLNGDIAEIIMYEKSLTPAEKTGLELYLNNKYNGLPVSLGPDIQVNYGFCNTTLDAGNRFKSYIWSTGATTQTIQVNSSGTYSVTATNNFGFVSVDTIQVTYPELTLHDSIFCGGDSINISPGLSGNYAYLWNSGQTTPSIYVSIPGNYNVNITDTAFCTKTSPVVAIAIDSFPLQASLGPTMNICSGNTAGLVSPLPLPPGLSYQWSTNESTPQIIIVNSGTYSLTVSDQHACVATDSVDINILGVAPTVSFSYSAGCSGFSTSFTNTSLPLTPFVLWNFGDGDTSTQANPDHLYVSSGNYTVTLTESDGSCSNFMTRTIHIRQTPVARFDTTRACIHYPYVFTDQSTSAEGNIVSWIWNFGDQTPTGYSQAPVHVYDTSGVFTVQLTVVTDSGCYGITQEQIVVASSALPPTPFTLYQPSDNFVTTAHSINFIWNPSANAAFYTLEYSQDSTFLTGTTSVSHITTNSVQLTIPSSNIFFWHVIAYNFCGNNISSQTCKFTIFSSLSVNGFMAWYKADSVHRNGNMVDTVFDCSGNGHIVIQNNNAFKPLFVQSIGQLNDQATLRFDGSNDYMDGGNVLNQGDNSCTIYIIGKSNFVNGTYLAKAINGNGSGRYAIYYYASDLTYLYEDNLIRQLNVTHNIGSYELITAISDRSVSLNKLFIDFQPIGNTAISSSYDMTSNYDFLLGAYNSSTGGVPPTGLYLDGDISEIMMFNKVLSPPERMSVENYLQCKYAAPVNLGPDIDIAYGVCDTVLDAGGRFKSFLWSTGETTQKIHVYNSGTYFVEATNIFGQISTDTVVVKIPGVVLHDTLFCLRDTISVAANMGTGYTYLWLPYAVNTNSINIFNPGTYSLTISDLIGCSRTVSFNAKADSFPVTASLGSDRKICKGDYIGLVSGQQEAVNYQWSDGSGNSLLVINDTLESYPTYSLTVTNTLGCIAYDTVHLLVNGLKPVAAFVSDSVCFGNSSHLTDQSSVPLPFTIVSYSWDFNDGTYSSQQNPVHQYVHDGIYHVNLSIATDSGCLSTVSKNVTVFSRPHVDFWPYQGCSGVPVSFTDISQCNIGHIANWDWKFNDTINIQHDTSSLQNPHYTFDSAGDYPVKFIVASNAGCTDSVEKTVTINQSPVMDFNYSYACAGQKVYFTDYISLKPWETIVTYNWSFGDSTSSIISNPMHIFDTAGYYQTTFSIMVSSGCRQSLTQTVDVGGIPHVDFLFGKNCILNLTGFSDNSIVTNGIINRWKWDFAGLGSNTIRDPSFLFPDTGTYLVSLQVNTDHQCTDSITLPVKIVAAPTALFSFTPEYGVPPLAVTFTNNSIGSSTYMWKFGDLDSSQSVNPVHTYNDQGIFQILLTSYNNIGCSDTTTAKVYVLPTSVDISVDKAYITTSNGRMYASADLTNKGTRRIDHIDMSVDFGNGNILHEQWFGSLAEGENLHYVFTVSYQIPENADVNFVCVKASLPDLIEDSLRNNILCTAMHDEFMLLDSYPDPVIDKVNLVFILPFADLVKINIFNDLGGNVKEIEFAGTQKGYNSVQADLSSLNSGVYMVTITFRDKILRKKFVKV